MAKTPHTPPTKVDFEEYRLDYRDSETVEVDVTKDVVLVLTKKDLEYILEGFAQQ